MLSLKDVNDQMTIKMDLISELPEIKSEINPDDFGAQQPQEQKQQPGGVPTARVATRRVGQGRVPTHRSSTTPQPQQPEQGNCQWVS